MTEETFYQYAQDCQQQEMGDESLIFNPNTRKTVHLNQTASLVWRLCDSHSVENIIDALQEQYPTQADEIYAEVHTIIKNLSDQSILTPRKK